MNNISLNLQFINFAILPILLLAQFALFAKFALLILTGDLYLVNYFPEYIIRILNDLVDFKTLPLIL